MIDVGSDGVAQIAAILEGQSDISAIYILAHGESGEINLGDAILDGTSIAGAHADILAQIGSTLTENGDILIYGCDFGDDLGAVKALAEVTGADVAASDDLTGAAEKGGDWDLEVQRGEIEADEVAAEDWDGVLAPLSIDVTGITATVGVDSEGRVEAVYAGGGSIGAQSIDIVLTVLDGTAPNFLTTGGDIRLATNTGGALEVEWSFRAAGTNNPATGAAAITISDIDGSGPGNWIERVTGRQELGFLSYAVNDPTQLEIDTANNQVLASGTVESGSASRPEAAVRFNFSNQTSFTIIYETTTSGRYFDHDGDGDFSFSNPVIVSLPQLDLDADDSTANGADFVTSFGEGGSAVGVVDSDVTSVRHSSFRKCLCCSEQCVCGRRSFGQRQLGGDRNSRSAQLHDRRLRRRHHGNNFGQWNGSRIRSRSENCDLRNVRRKCGHQRSCD